MLRTKSHNHKHNNSLFLRISSIFVMTIPYLYNMHLDSHESTNHLPYPFLNINPTPINLTSHSFLPSTLQYSIPSPFIHNHQTLFQQTHTKQNYTRYANRSFRCSPRNDDCRNPGWLSNKLKNSLRLFSNRFRNESIPTFHSSDSLTSRSFALRSRRLAFISAVICEIVRS